MGFHFVLVYLYFGVLGVSAQSVSAKQFLNYNLLGAWPGVSAADVSDTPEKRVVVCPHRIKAWPSW